MRLLSWLRYRWAWWKWRKGRITGPMVMRMIKAGVSVHDRQALYDYHAAQEPRREDFR